MNTVVIVENSRKLIDNYIRMLEACKEKIECKYFNANDYGKFAKKMLAVKRAFSIIYR